MTAVRTVDSFKYGARLFAYLFVILLVGGGLLGLGALIIENANTSLSNGVTGIPDKTELAGGSVLALLGGFVLLSGLFGIVFKLVADGVETGGDLSVADAASVASGADASTNGDQSAGTDTAPTQTGPSPGEQAARDHGSGTTVPSGASSKPPETPEPPAPADPPEGTDESPDPEPTPSGAGATTEEAPDSAAKSGRPTPEPPEESAGSEETAKPDFSNPVEDEQSATERAIEEGFGTAADAPEADEESSESPILDSDEFETDESVEEPEPAAEDTEATSGEDVRTADDISERSRPEPSPEEIAFGTSDDDADADEETQSVADDDEEGGTDDTDEDSEGLAPFEELDEEGSSVDTAGDSSSGDPLADPTDDE